MIRYIGILEKEPASLWGIWFPDVSGCVSAADTAELTIEQASEALELWIEDAVGSGADLPRARTIEELRQDPEVAEALAKGDAAIVVSLPASHAEFSFGDEAIAAIDQAAAARGVTRTDFMRQAVLEKIGC